MSVVIGQSIIRLIDVVTFEINHHHFSFGFTTLNRKPTAALTIITVGKVESVCKPGGPSGRRLTLVSVA